MKQYFIVIGLLIPVLMSFAQSPKKGIGYGQHSDADMAALSPAVSWWYNWFHQPESGVFDTYESHNMEFVPMAWNGAFNEIALRSFLDNHPDVQYLLGFNEPNFVSQANMTPQAAATIWPTLEAIADDYNLKLVAPAVNYCDVCVDIPGNDDSNPTAWLDAFFAECTGCQVDYIAAHWYACDVGALAWYVSQFDKYGLPIWITEIACWEGTPTLATQKNYMIGAVDFMEQDPRVYRYAWFSGRSNGPFNSLLSPASGVRTQLGDLYVNFNPVHDTSIYTHVPARIEAEDYTQMSGILLESTQDVDGFANVGWIEAGDWLDYNINVSEAEVFQFKMRTAGFNTGTTGLLLDGISVKDITITPTGGWQTWKTISSTIDLTPGRHTLRLSVKAAGFNLNWIQIGTDEMVSTSDVEDISPYIVYPQPVTGNQLNVRFEKPLHEMVIMSLFDLQGRSVYDEQTLVETDILSIDMTGLSIASGAYLLQVVTPQKAYTTKVIMIR